jgi:hypothetical protein
VTSHSVSERAAPAAASPLRTAPAAWAYLALGALAIAIYFVLPPDAQSVFYVAIGGASVAAICVGAVRNLPRGQRLPWLLFALGLLGQVIGDAIFAFYEVSLNREPPSSPTSSTSPGTRCSLSAPCWCCAASAGRARGDRYTVLTSAGSSSSSGCSHRPVQPHGVRERVRPPRLAYPAMDILLLVALAQLVGPGRRDAYALLLASVGLWVVPADLRSRRQRLQGGGWIDARGWLVRRLGRRRASRRWRVWRGPTGDGFRD